MIGGHWPSVPPMRSAQCHQNGPVAGVCPYVVRSSSTVVDVEGPVSPSVPAAVDLSVCHAEQLPLNLSVSSAVFQTASDAAVQPTSHAAARRCPPPAHCHVTGRGVLDSRLSTDALNRLQSQTWTVSCPDNHLTDPGTASSAGDDALRSSLSVLSAAAALRSEMLDTRRLAAVAGDVVTSTVNASQVRRTSSHFV